MESALLKNRMSNQGLFVQVMFILKYTNNNFNANMLTPNHFSSTK